MSDFIILDANLLVLLAVGSVEPGYIRSHKRLSSYDPEDFTLLLGYLDRFLDMTPVPHVLAEAHEKLYGFRLGADVRLVTVRVEARGLLPPPVRPLLAAGGGAVPSSWTIVHWAAGSARTALYDRTALGAGDRFTGPAIVTQLDTTILVPPGSAAEVHATGTLLLRRC